MAERIHKATLSQSQGREGWSVIFRHPVLLDRASGKPGRRVRRGLGTRDEKVALGLVVELNELLADKNFWLASSRPVAVSRFSPIVVDIFYHDITPEAHDPVGIRDAVIPLPGPGDCEYRRVLLLGATGGGKTTLVRQLIGTDPYKERFPSTSTAKTTVADTEIVIGPGPFRAVVTFLPRDQVRDYVEGCISAAVLGAYRGEADDEVLRRALNHVDQRFRLSYVLGTGREPDAEDDDEDDEGADEPSMENAAERDSFDLAGTRALLRSAPQRIRAIAADHASVLREELRAGESDERVIEELFEESLDNRVREDERFQSLADEFIDEIERRFELLTSGKVEKTKQGWPRSWSSETEDRGIFLKLVSRFSSNYAPFFGMLLTPLVNGIRVAGPFRPTWSERSPALVLFDVEGLGHTPDAAASLPTAVTRRLESVDAVLLVDNATQPMQAAPVSAMRNLASSGLTGKLIVCFTHFDGVMGDNIPTVRLKGQHVLASAENALTSIGEQLGFFAERALRQRLASSCFFLGGLQRPLSGNTKSEKRTVARLQELLGAIDGIVAKAEPVTSRPVYDRMNLVLAVKQAAEDFHAAWNARLGLRLKTGFLKEHWSRIKALARRLAEGWDDEYMNLKPLADMHREVQESIYRFMQAPVSWTGAVPSDDEKQQIFSEFAQLVSLRLLVVVAERMQDEAIAKWQKAYSVIGKGSSFERASMIAIDIYGRAVPPPEAAPNPDRNKFLNEVMEVVRRSAEDQKIVLQ